MTDCYAIALLGLALLGFAPQTVHAASTPEDVLRDRVQSFTTALMQEKYDDALPFVDPDIVEKLGKDKLKEIARQWMLGIINLNTAFGRKLTGFRVHKVEFVKPDTA